MTSKPLGVLRTSSTSFTSSDLSLLAEKGVVFLPKYAMPSLHHSLYTEKILPEVVEFCQFVSKSWWQEFGFILLIFFFGATSRSESGDQISKYRWPFSFSWNCWGPIKRLPIAFEIFCSNTWQQLKMSFCYLSKQRSQL